MAEYANCDMVALVSALALICQEVEKENPPWRLR